MKENGTVRSALPWVIGVIGGCAAAAGVVCCVWKVFRRRKGDAPDADSCCDDCCCEDGCETLEESDDSCDADDAEGASE